jgi:hypothetical protein
MANLKIILSYTYLNDIVGTFYKDSIGSVYYIKDPSNNAKKH